MNFRYPGPQSFHEEDELLFHGRKRETKELFDLVMAQSPVVLFAKSGMGKTSLLQAGIIPRLRFSQFDAVKIRLNRTDIPPETQVKDALFPNLPPDTLLWEALLKYNRERLGTPLLIFDQFEELFTLYSDSERSSFVQQLADVINAFLPEKIRQQIREKITDETLSNVEAASLEQTPKVKIVFSIRSDLLHCLHYISDEIPSILRNRYELLGLQADQAREAIIRPAEQAQELGDYGTPAFSWSSAAINQILNFLGRKKQVNRFTTIQQNSEIETFQLQLLCEHIEKKILLEVKEEKYKATDLVITPEFYGNEPGIEMVLANFYENAIFKIEDSLIRHNSRRLIEDHLIVNQRRVSVDENTIALTHGVPLEVLDELVETRLLRREIRDTGNYYELSHDTLMPPILRSKEVWDQLESIRLARISEEKIRIETQRRRKAVLVAITAFVMALISIIALFFAYLQFRKAEQAKTEILRNAVQSQRRLAQMLKIEGKYKEAIVQLNNITKFAGDINAPYQDSIIATIQDWTKVDLHITKAEAFAKMENLNEALLEYDTAYFISPDARIDASLKQTSAELERKFEDYCSRGDQQVVAKQYQFALENYRKALHLKPFNTQIRNKVLLLEKKTK